MYDDTDQMNDSYFAQHDDYYLLMGILMDRMKLRQLILSKQIVKEERNVFGEEYLWIDQNNDKWDEKQIAFGINAKQPAIVGDF